MRAKFLIFFFVCLQPAYADVITLKSGKKVEGIITERTGAYIKIEFGGAPLYYERKYIADIQEGKPQAARQGIAGLSIGRGATQPDEADSILRKGLHAACEGKFDEARAEFEKGKLAADAGGSIAGALAILDKLKSGAMKEDYAGYIFKGAYALLNNDYKLAIIWLEQAHRMDPSDSDVCYNLGLAYYSDDRHEKAIEYLTKSLGSGRDDAGAYALLGTSYYITGDLRQSRDSFKKAGKLFKIDGDEAGAGSIARILTQIEEGGDDDTGD